MLSPKYIVVAGCDTVADKLGYLASGLRDRGFETVYLSEQWLASKTSSRSLHPSGNLFRRAREWKQLLLTQRPCHVEMYLDAKPWVLLIYYLIMRQLRVPYLVWLRGEILEWEKNHWIRRWVDRLLIEKAGLVIYKELYMQRLLAKFNVRVRNAHFLHNRIPVRPDGKFAQFSKQVLFFNSYKRWRRVDIVVDSAGLVAKQDPDVRYRVIGSTLHLDRYSPASKDYEAELRARRDHLGLGAVVAFEPFTPGAKPFPECSMFLLPSDIVFCNFALLEAMERGLVPIIANVEGADQIVTDGVDGFIVPQEPEAVASRVLLLLKDRDRWAQMSRAARDKVAAKFDVESSLNKLVDELYPNVWSRL
jgi:glycosyltransferase involved in cell wall biosynthesis